MGGFPVSQAGIAMGGLLFCAGLYLAAGIPAALMTLGVLTALYSLFVLDVGGKR
jgi:hypothetical protein